VVGGDGHFDFVTHSQQQNTSLGLSQGHLTDDFIEALREEFFSDGADAALTSLALHQFLIQGLSQTSHIHSRRFLVANVFDEIFACLTEITSFQ